MRNIYLLVAFCWIQVSGFGQISNSWIHQTTSANIQLWWTNLSSSWVLDPDDLIITQHRIRLGDPAQDHVNSVIVTPTVSRILNEDQISMVEDVQFNMLRAGDDLISFVHTIASGNHFGYQTIINHPALNNDPDALFFFSHNYEPNSVANDHITGVLYNGTRWAIFNENVAVDLPDEASFNIIVPPTSEKVFVHISATGNINTNQTSIDHPDLNGNPNARFFIRHNLSKSTSGGHNKNVGVYYNPFTDLWTIYNEDLSNFSTGKAFNVMIPDSDGDGFADHNDRCHGYDDAIDRDQDGTPDYCDDPFQQFCDSYKIIYEDHLAGEILQYQAEFSVTSDRIINSGADITFRTNEHFLNAGFEVKLGATFTTTGTDCTSMSR